MSPRIRKQRVTLRFRRREQLKRHVRIALGRSVALALVAGFGVGVQGDRKTAGKLRAATLVAADRPNSQQLTLIDPQKLGEAAGFGVCNGDSGGPVLDERDRALVGIVSWSARTDGEPICGFMSGVIPLARYRYWILETAARLGSPLAP